MQCLSQITLSSPDITQTATMFKRLLNLPKQSIISDLNTVRICLPNIELIIQSADGSHNVSILDARLSRSLLHPVDFIIDHHFFTHY